MKYKLWQGHRIFSVINRNYFGKVDDSSYVGFSFEINFELN